MTMIETWTTDDGVIVELHDTPPEAYEGDGAGIAHCKAWNALATVVLPISKGLLEDGPAIRTYVKVRLLLFLQMETERVQAEGAIQ